MRSFTLGQRSKLALGVVLWPPGQVSFLASSGLAHLQASLDEVKLEPVGGRTGQAAGNLDRVDPGAQQGLLGPGWCQSSSAPELPCPHRQPLHSRG